MFKICLSQFSSKLAIIFIFSACTLTAEDFKVQRGVATIPAGSVNLVLNAPANFTSVTDLTKAFVRITDSNYMGAGGIANQFSREVCANIVFNATNQITISRKRNTNSTRVSWEIVEYIGPVNGDNDFFVRNSAAPTVTFANKGLTADIAAVGVVNTAKVVPFITGVNGGKADTLQYFGNQVTSAVINATTVRISRGSVDKNNPIIVSCAVVEFTGANWSVQRAEHQYSAAGVAQTKALGNAVAGLNNAFIHAQKRITNTSNNGTDEFGHQVWLSSTNQVSFKLRSGATTPNVHWSVAWVISNPDMIVNRGNGTLTGLGVSPFTGTIAVTTGPNLANASLFWNNDCSGAGTSFPNPMVSVTLSALNTINYWRAIGTAGVTNDYRYEVVQWPITPKYSITYNGNTNDGGTVPVDGNNPYWDGSTVTVLGNTGNLTKSGLVFSNWNTAANGSGTPYAPAATFAIGANVTLYAQWSLPPTYSVTYNGNTNDGGTVPVDGSSPYLQGFTVTVLGNTGNLTKSGYTFNGWNTVADGSGTAYAPAATFAMGTSAVILYAQWTLIPTYAVTYDGNTNDGGSIPLDGSSPYIQGATVTVLGNTGNLTKTGNLFDGWNTAANGSGTAYAPAATFTMGTSAVILYAQWTPPTYTVTYNGNGNNGGTVPVDGSSPYIQGATVTVLDNTGTLTKVGSTFAGWNTAANGSGTAYVPATTFSIGTSNVILYAQWQVALTISGTVYTDEAKTTPIAAGTSVGLSVNGAAAISTATDGSGQFTFTPTVAPNDVILAFLNSPTPVTAYHALYAGATGTNITKGNGNANLAATNLLDQSDGSDSGYDIAIAYNVAMTTGDNTDKDATGGDAFDIFNGKINLDGQYAYTDAVDGTDFGTVTFSNLDTNKKYTIALYHNRDAGADRLTRYTISGIDSATQASSGGVTVVSPTVVEYDADNTADGFIARWTDVDPTTTTVTITLTKTGGGWAYAPLAIMLQEQVLATSSGSLVTVTDGVTELINANSLELVTGKIILEHQTGTEITNTQLDLIDSVDAGDDDGISISAGNATFASSREVWITAGKTYNPGGNLTFTDIELFGTLIGGANTFTVNGSWDNNGGSFTPNTSTVLFASAADADIDGSSTFNNFRCMVPVKTLTFEQGSTQTIGGYLTLQGDRSTDTRINLRSSGGAGTTWNLVINGEHDCNFIDTQGANVSGTCYLPINPAGYFDSGNNTNWYAAYLPEDVVFYDNFENSTLGSAAPDRESSLWTDDAGWIDTPAETVNTQNRTPGGAHSMYAEPTAPGVGDAAWNNPEWGPVDNGVAECWFYDDMDDGANGKHQWASVESSDGDEWLAIGVYTTTSSTKYCYHQGSGFAPQTRIATFIDRSVGWHKGTWIRDENFISLYLDDVLIFQGPNTQLDNFADFDLGSWDYDNLAGSTGMWFDDCVVYRSQHQSKYRWYANDDAQNPTPIDAEDTAITREIGQLTRLRIQLQNDMSMDWGTSATYIGLQFREGTSGSWEELGASSDWEYVDGLGTDGSQITNALLTNTNIRNHFVESQPSSQIITANPTEYPEWDFALQATSSATVGSDYYFRMVVTDASGAYLKQLAAYPYLAECQIVSLSMWIWTGAVSNDWNDPGNWNQPTIPDANSDVIIQTAAVRDPRINIAGAVCKSLVLQTGRTLLLDSPNTDLTVSGNVTLFGDVTHSNNTAVLNVNSGEIRIDGGSYNHTGNGALNAPNADLRILNGGAYNFNSAATVNLKDLYVDNFGAFNDGTASGTLNVNDFNLLANGQFSSNQIGSVYNIAGNFANDGSMLGSTGGVFNFNGTAKTYSGTAPNHLFYQANFNGTYTVASTADITFLDDVTIGVAGSLTAGTGTLNVGGDWTNSNTFVHGSGSVNFNGTAFQQVTSGGSDWYNLNVSNGSGAGVSFLDGFSTTTFTNTTANSTMTFNAGSTYNITGASGLTLNGTSGNEITLLSSVPGTFWLINPSGSSWNVDYVNVTDSINTNGDAILPTNSINGGNNIGWFSLDSDNDEVPDYYEYIHYGGLVYSALSDTDGDGLSLLEEFVLDSDPNVDGTPVLFVDDNAGYIGDGSSGAPFKYIKEALDAAGTGGTLISLEEGTYELDDYYLTKKVIIRGSKGAVKTIIHGGTPDGGTSDSGSFLQVASKDFALTHVTLRMFRDDKPIITYTGASDVKTFLLNGVIFRDNNTQTKAMIAPSATDKHKYVYMFNCLFYNNSALSAAIMDATKDANAYNNTLVDNTFTSAIILSGSSKRYTLYNNILRNSNTEISDVTISGTALVSNCNIEGGYLGAIASYDTPETFADAANGYYRLLLGSAGENAGITTEINWDLDNVSRPKGVAFDVGCFETDPNDEDGDGLTTAQETAAGTSQADPDTDGDGISDGEEINTWGTNPISTNSDGDFINDGDEPAMGMDPAVDDGDGDIDGVYYTGFESDVEFPVGPLMDTIWGPNGNVNSSLVIKGNMTIENVGAAAAVDGVKIGKAEGSPGGGLVESSFVGWVDRNSLDNYWMSISYKAPRAKLPTDLNEAFNLGGSFFAIDENGYLNIWEPSNEEWLKDTQVIPDDWARITVHRNHPGKVVNMWVETRQAFANVPISDPDPTAGTGKFRISFSSVGEQDAFFDLFSALPFAPF